MTIEQYFKDKINWRVYNAIFDACIKLDDGEISYRIEVGVMDREDVYLNDLLRYKAIFVYTKSNDDNGTECYVNNEDSVDPEHEIREYISRYNSEGLFYKLVSYQNIDEVVEKIKSFKYIKLVSDDSSAKVKRYTFVAI